MREERKGPGRERHPAAVFLPLLAIIHPAKGEKEICLDIPKVKFKSRRGKGRDIHLMSIRDETVKRFHILIQRLHSQRVVREDNTMVIIGGASKVFKCHLISLDFTVDSRVKVKFKQTEAASFLSRCSSFFHFLLTGTTRHPVLSHF